MLTDRLVLTWMDVQNLADHLASRWRGKYLTGVYGIPRGGIPVAALVASNLAHSVLDQPVEGCLIVDDLIDSGATGQHPEYRWFWRDALLCKPTTPQDQRPEGIHVADLAPGGWVVFPWDEAFDGSPTGEPLDAVRRLLQWVGEDPNRDGLVDTPGRVVRSLRELTAGYPEDPAEILGTTFDEHSDEMVIVRGIEFTSLCEHHLLPFTGTAIVGYLPGDRVVGLSKLARLVEAYARRLQVQERMTRQIALAIEDHLHASGVGVIITARHSCMGCRGVRKPTAEMVTSAMLGVLREDGRARAEFLALAKSS